MCAPFFDLLRRTRTSYGKHAPRQRFTSRHSRFKHHAEYGIPLFIIGRKQAGQTGSILGYFTKWEKVLCAAVIILGIVGIIYSISSGVFTA